jgi:hypothetical protein
MTDPDPDRHHQLIAVAVSAIAERDLEFRLDDAPQPAAHAPLGNAEAHDRAHRSEVGDAGAREHGELMSFRDERTPACIDERTGVRCVAPLLEGLVTPAAAPIDRAARARAVGEAEREPRRDTDGDVDAVGPRVADLVGPVLETRETEFVHETHVDAALGQHRGADPARRGRQIRVRGARERGERDDKQRNATSHALTILAFGALALGGCLQDVADISEVYYRGPGQRVLCAVSIDEGRADDEVGLATGLDRARDEGVVLQLYSHIPGVSISFDRLTRVLDAARDRGLSFYTYDDFANGVPAGPGVALSFDDAAVDAWAMIADDLDAHDAKVTFFVAYYDAMDATKKEQLRDLAARGHVIGNHTLRHVRAPDYTQRHGMRRYLDDEVHSEQAALRADGYEPRTFAYPFGARTGELDHALLEEFDVIRTVSFPRDNVFTVDPCVE